jgi:hypothetical protein
MRGLLCQALANGSDVHFIWSAARSAAAVFSRKSRRLGRSFDKDSGSRACRTPHAKQFLQNRGLSSLADVFARAMIFRFRGRGTF